MGGLIAGLRQQGFDPGLFLGSEREERRTYAATVVAVEVAGVLDAGYSEDADDALVRFRNALLFLAGKLQIVIFPG